MARPTVIVAVLALMALVVAACGGTAPTPTAAPTARPTPTAAPTATPTLPTATPYPPSTIVTFPDGILETVIRDALGKEAGEEITAGELAELTELHANESDDGVRPASPGQRRAAEEVLRVPRGIADLSGIRYCTNLTTLALDENQISDISSLASLTNLTWLVLTENRIGDVSPLASLTNLTTLTLSGNQINDISPLVEYRGLGAGDEIWLDDNPLLDLSEGSEDLENIRQLEARGVDVRY